MTQEDRVELLPCPFCGSAKLDVFDAVGEHSWKAPFVSCENCYASVESGSSAREAWNRRTPTAAPDLVEALKELLALPAATYAMKIVKPTDEVPEAAWWRAKTALAKLELTHDR